MKKSILLLGVGCLTAGMAAAETPSKESAEAKSNEATELEAVEVTTSKNKKKVKSRAEQDRLPQTTESVTIQKLEETNNAMNTADMVKYMPSVSVRKRYVGDTNAPMSTRTTTMSQSARSLIYADGILLSSLLGNNNGNTGSPLWDTVSPSEIERIDMMYGPFSAAYAGNSVGGVLDITTKMPTKFEASAGVQSTWQDYNFFGHKATYDAQQYTAAVGDRVGDFSFRFNYSHLDSVAQPIAYAMSNPGTLGKGTSTVTGGELSSNPYGSPTMIFGETNITHTVQDNFKWKLAYDITPSIKAAYTLGLWLNDANTRVNSFSTPTNGGTNVYSGGVEYMNGYKFTMPSMAGNLTEQRRWSHGMSIKQDTGGLFDWSINASVVDYGKDTTRAPQATQAVVGGLGYSPLGGLGKTTSMTGTGWHIVDVKGIWRPQTSWADHEVSLGFHHDFYELVNPTYNTMDWQYGGNATINTVASGKTQTNAVWLQDIVKFNPQWQLTLGGRLENWNAYDGVNLFQSNYDATKATSVTAPQYNMVNGQYVNPNQAGSSAFKFSPKASLKWNPDNNWQMTASIGHAYRFATVTELYQNASLNVTTNTTTQGNPNLKPENTLSSELAAQYSTDGGRLRLSLFQERTNNLMYSQTTQLATGGFLSTTQNIGQVNSYGIELAGEKQEIGRYIGIEGLDFSANGTWVDSRIAKDGNNGMIVSGNTNYTSAATCPGTWKGGVCQVNVNGNRQPRLPEFRASATMTYHPIKPLTLSTSLRYSSQQYGQLDNSDTAHMSYTGLGSFFVVDTRFRYEITKQLALSGGIDNINNDRYILYHPFPGRTYMAELKFNY